MSHDGDFSLKPYSIAQGSRSVGGVGLHIERRGHTLDFQFTVADADLLKWPGPVEDSATRRDELWKTTVFELFLTTQASAKYFEVNLSPGGDWNIYSFEDYRSGMARVAAITHSPLKRASHSSATDGQVSGSLDGSLDLSLFPLVGPVVFGATAVLEYQDGRKEYWALAHAGEKPDFHLRASFTGVMT